MRESLLIYDSIEHKKFVMKSKTNHFKFQIRESFLNFEINLSKL